MLELGGSTNDDDRKVCEVLLILLFKCCYEYHYIATYTVIDFPMYLGNEGFDIENNLVKYYN